MPDDSQLVELRQSVQQLKGRQDLLEESQKETKGQISEVLQEQQRMNEAIEKNDSATAQELHEMKQTLSTIKDLLQAWNDAKGFVKWIGYIATFMKWMMIIGTTSAAVYFALRNGVDFDTAKEITGPKK